MELRYYASATWQEGHTRGGYISIDLNGEDAKELLNDLIPIIQKHQQKAEKIAKEKFGDRGTIKCQLEKIDTRDEYGDTLEVCNKHGEVCNIESGCNACKLMEKPLLTPEEWEKLYNKLIDI